MGLKKSALVENFFRADIVFVTVIGSNFVPEIINVQMKRFYSLFLMALMASFFTLQAAEVTFDFSTAEGITAMGYAVPEQSAGTNLVDAGPVTVDGVSLSAVTG